MPASDFEQIARMRDESYRRIVADLQDRLTVCYWALLPLRAHIGGAHPHDRIVAHIGNRPEAVIMSIHDVRSAIALIESVIDTTGLGTEQEKPNASGSHGVPSSSTCVS